MPGRVRKYEGLATCERVRDDSAPDFRQMVLAGARKLLDQPVRAQVREHMAGLWSREFGQLPAHRHCLLGPFRAWPGTSIARTLIPLRM
jgi:hypothetical protein